MHAAILVLLLAIFLLSGCSGGPAEAVVSRQQAEELTHRAVVYEWLFGRESEWVTGTRLLAQFYEEAAREEEQLASRHLELLGDDHAPSPPTRSLGH